MACLLLSRRAPGVPAAEKGAALQEAKAAPAFASTAYSFELGEVRVNCMTDGDVTCAAAHVFGEPPDSHEACPNSPATLLRDDCHADLRALFPSGRASLSFGCALLQLRDGQNVLLDSSLGCVHPDAYAGLDVKRKKGLPDLLRTGAGVTPEDVDLVVHSHLHRSSTGWNVVPSEDGALRPLFQNARHVIQRAEWFYWTSTPELREECRYEQNLRPLEAKGMIELVDGEVELLPGLLLTPCPGHTPGHQIVRIDGGDGEVGYWMGDLLHQVQQISEPSCCPISDVIQQGSAPSRAALLARIESERALLLSPHLAFPGAGYLSRDDRGRFCFSAREEPARGPGFFSRQGRR